MSEFAPSLRAATEADPGALPSLVRTANELRDAASNLASRRRPFGGETAKALQLTTTALTQQSHLVDVDRLGRNLVPLESYRRAMALPSLAESQQQQSRRDLHDSIVQNVLEMTMNSLREEVQADFDKHVRSDWESTKERVMRMFAEDKSIALSSDRPTDEVPKKVPSPLDELPTAVISRSEETPKMSHLYRVLVDSPNSNESTALRDACDKFVRASVTVGSTRDACEIWSMLKYFFLPVTGTLKRSIAPNRLLCKRAMAARAFLEQQFREKRLGSSIPIADDHAWDQMQNDPITNFEKIFKLVRSGSWEYAVEKAKLIGLEKLSKALERVLLCQGKSGLDIGPEEGSKDPHEQCLFSLWDSNFQAHDKLMSSVEDFLWLRLVAITCVILDEDEAEKKVLELIKAIEECGPGYFGNGSNPFLYARILATCGDVEGALNYLARYSSVHDNSTMSDPLPDAVHFAIILSRAYPTALQIAKSDSKSSADLIVLDEKGRKKFKLAKLLEMYSARFTDHEKAMYYATCLNPPVAEEDVLPAKKILARPHPSGGPLPLLKVLKLNLKDDVKSASIAFAAAKESRPADAVQIYYESFKGKLFEGKQSESLDRALELVARELARVMDMDPKNREREYWKKEAARFEPLRRGNESLRLEHSKLFAFILECTKFYDRFFQGDVDAPSVLETWLLPTTPVTPQGLNERVEKFQTLDRVIIDAFPNLLSAVIECNAKAFQANKIKESQARLQSLVAFVAALREQLGYRLRYDVEDALRMTYSRINV